MATVAALNHLAETTRKNFFSSVLLRQRDKAVRGKSLQNFNRQFFIFCAFVLSHQK
jgi:hypothetical protein